MTDSRGPVVLAVCPQKRQLQKSPLSPRNLLGRMPNIGIMYLAGALERVGYDVVTLDRQHSAVTPEQLAREMLRFDPVLIGFTLYDITMDLTQRTIEALRQAYRGPIVVGGYTATFHAETILAEWPQVDYVVVREGEYAITALMEYIENRRALEDVPNLVYRTSGGVRFNSEAPLVDVRAIPWPRRTWPETSDVTAIVSRRGCQSRCAFCSMVPFYDTRLGAIVRWRDPADVADEIAYCIDHGSRYFMFYDDDFGLSTERERKWCGDFLEAVARRRLTFSWSIETRVADVVRGTSVLRECCEAGLEHVSMGMESMLPRQLKLYNKGYKQEDIFKAVEIAKSLPADFQTNVIFWDPWVTIEEALEHVRLLESIEIYDQLTSANFSVFAGHLDPYRGTRIYQQLEAAGMLRRRSGTLTGYTYSFVDPAVTAFVEGPHREFSRRSRRTHRPPALWLNVPRLEQLGDRATAAKLRTYARAVARTEFEYFKTLLAAWSGVTDGADAYRAAEVIHDEYGPKVDACADLLAGLCVTEPRVQPAAAAHAAQGA